MSWSITEENKEEKRFCLNSFPPPGESQRLNVCLFWNGDEKMKLGPLTGHKPGQIPSKKYFSTIFRTGILRSFFWEGSQGLGFE